MKHSLHKQQSQKQTNNVYPEILAIYWADYLKGASVSLISACH